METKYIWTTYKIGMKTRKLFPGAVVASSGVVVTGEGCPFLIFLNGFCREDGGDSFYGDGFSKACTWMSRSSRKDGRREI
ncbi:hypothetical protein MtrunA17_Chr8g0351911 [Medicago truncatula]|uniref:Uncharacterized protein n=1 Tax=Medicago truncatula TaxID=3880 RepID=A0A396GFV4_MEDTR|nr:hypothetical protein MtrunA17_Chr8g0351911 [Medicago truncatula]